MHILVTGGTGFIGRALCAELLRGGHSLQVLSRQPDSVAMRLSLPGVSAIADLASLPADTRIDAVINLAGEPIADARWTASRRRLLEQSRIGVTRAIDALLSRLAVPPAVMISGSAIGYYGDCGEREVDEDAPAGRDYAAQLCADWEQAAAPVAARGTRVCLLRTGVVLHPDGGALARMLPVFRLGLGGRIGDGRQWMSWIHRDDVVALVLQALQDERYRGPCNATAPHPVRNGEFTRALAAAVRRPAVMPVPALALKLALGEASSLLLGSQRVLPGKAMACGFSFRYPTLASALAAL